MKGWNGKDYGFYIGSVVLSYALVRIAAMLCGTLMVPALLSMAVFALLPCLGAIFVIYRLKKQAKGIWLPIAVPAVFDLLWILLAFDLSAATDFVSIFTGYDNNEASAFFLLFAILFCSGLLVGAILGACLPCPEHNSRTV